jgi:hypothetical protein
MSFLPRAARRLPSRTGTGTGTLSPGAAFLSLNSCLGVGSRRLCASSPWAPSFSASSSSEEEDEDKEDEKSSSWSFAGAGGPVRYRRASLALACAWRRPWAV